MGNDLKSVMVSGGSELEAISKLEKILPRPVGSEDYIVRPDIKVVDSNGVFIACTTYQLKESTIDKVIRKGMGAYLSPLESRLSKYR